MSFDILAAMTTKFTELLHGHVRYTNTYKMPQQQAGNLHTTAHKDAAFI